jgi:hypothetical protein
VERFNDLTTDDNLMDVFSAVQTRREQLDE